MRPTSPKAAAVHVPLRRVAFCLDCEACFELGPDNCPACGAETWAPLARFLEGRPHPAVEARGAHGLYTAN